MDAGTTDTESFFCPCGGAASPSGELPGMWQCAACEKVYADRRFLARTKPRPRIRAEPTCLACGSTNIAEAGPLERMLDVGIAIAAVAEHQPEVAVQTLKRHRCRSCGRHW